jgi:enoyl-CoA hydratase/carnithine racemase
MSEAQNVLFSVDESIARVTLNRPDKRNALNDELVSEFKDALKAAADNESVRVVFFKGAGQDFL